MAETFQVYKFIPVILVSFANFFLQLLQCCVCWVTVVHHTQPNICNAFQYGEKCQRLFLVESDDARQSSEPREAPQSLLGLPGRQVELLLTLMVLAHDALAEVYRAASVEESGVINLLLLFLYIS